MPFKQYVAEINLGQGGLSGSKNKSLVSPSELLVATNITYESDIISKEGGAAKYNSTAVPTAGTILGGHDWFASNAYIMILYTSGGYLLKETSTGVFGVTLASGLSTTARPVFVEGGVEALASNQKLFVFTGADPVKCLFADGVTAPTISSPPADWSGSTQPICGCMHDGRLWGGLSHRVYYSTTSDHGDFTSSGSGQLIVGPGTGRRILAMISFKGVIFVFKEDNGIFIIDTSAFDYTSATTPKVHSINQSIGIKSPHAVTQIDDDVIFMDATGSLQLLSGIDNFNITGAQLDKIHRINEFIRDNVNMTYLNQVQAVYYHAKHEVHFSVPRTGSTKNNARLVLDLNHPDSPRFRWSDRDVCESMWLRRDSTNVRRLMAGDDSGFVWKLDQDTRSKNGVGYLGEFQTPHLDFGYLDPSLAAKNKLGCELEIQAEPRDGVTLSVDVFWDSTYRHTITFDLNPQGTALGSFTIGTDSLGSDQLISIRRKKILGSGRRLSLLFYNNAAGGDFAIARAFVRFKAGNERINHT